MERRMSKPRLIAVVGAMLAALLISAVALAQIVPHTFYGFSGDTTVDGEAADGATVVAWAAGEQVGSDTLDASGEWSIDVDGGTAGVSFSVNGFAADGSYDADAGGSTRVALAVSTPVEEPEDTGELEGDEVIVDEVIVDDDEVVVDGDEAAVDGDEAAVDDDEAAVDVDEAAVDGDEDAMTGDEDAMTGDEDAMTGDEDAMTGDEDAMTGDEDAMTGDEDAMTGDEDAMTGDEAAVDRRRSRRGPVTKTP